MGIDCNRLRDSGWIGAETLADWAESAGLCEEPQVPQTKNIHPDYLRYEDIIRGAVEPRPNSTQEEK